MTFCKGILPPSPAPGDKKPIQQKKLGPAGWKAALPCSEQAGHEADVGLAAERANTFLVCVGNCAATRSREVSLHLCSAPGRPCQAQHYSPQIHKRSSNTGAGPAKGPEGVEELENLSGGETESWGYSEVEREAGFKGRRQHSIKI